MYIYAFANTTGGAMKAQRTAIHYNTLHQTSPRRNTLQDEPGEPMEARRVRERPFLPATQQHFVNHCSCNTLQHTAIH